MLLQIDGWYGGGKSVLLGLLDGHPDIAPNPIHEATHMMGLRHDMKQMLKFHDIEELRRKLVTTQYYLLEKCSLNRHGNVSFGAGIDLHPPFEFDFYAFDRKWIEELSLLDDWSVEKVVDTVYSCYASFLTGRKSWKYYVSMSWPVLELQRNFISHFDSAKTIFVNRPIDQIIAVRSGRAGRHDTNDTFFAQSFDKLIKSGEITKIKEYNEFIDSRCAAYPDRYHKVEFDDLIFSREATMKSISEFLKIEFSRTMLTWTFIGMEIKHEGRSYVDEINDHPERILNAQQIALLRRLISQSSRVDHYFLPSRVVRKAGTALRVLSEKMSSIGV